MQKVLLCGIIAALAAIIPSTVANFAQGSVELTDANFDKTVLKDEQPWLVAFYAPWCGHCKNLAPDWGKAATALKGIVPFGAVDADQHKSLGGKYGVSGFPTIKVFGDDKKKPTDYSGGRDLQTLVQGAMQVVQKIIQERLGGGGGGGGGSGSGSEVVELTDADFNKKVMDSDELWIVAFTAPWCGHCKKLEPEFVRASSDMKGQAVKFGNLDATAHQATAQRFGVNGYPTIKVFGVGAKSSEGEDYQGGRSASDFVAFAQEELLKNAPPPEVVQMNGSAVYESDCQPKQLCFIAFLPLLQDSGKAGREDYIKSLQDSADRYKREPYGWTWVEGTVQESLENTFGVGGSGYPALVTINAKKSAFAVMRGQFSSTGIGEFVNRVKAGRYPTATFNEFPSIVETQSWDGSDFDATEFEEEFDLSELLGDDDDEDEELMPRRRSDEDL